MKVGIIGGLGPLATAAFYKRIVERTDAKQDQDHIETLIYSRPQIPKRVEYILGTSEDNPADMMRETALDLERWGADMIVLPCVTAHFFYEEITKDLKIPFLNMLDETISVLNDRKIKTVGILGTSGTVQGGHLQKALEKAGISYVLPQTWLQEKIDFVIFNRIKCGEDVETKDVQSITNALLEEGAEVNLLACTELSALNMRSPFDERYVDMMDILAKSVVRKCGKNIRE
jgi:aspartate racemase